jgi:SAM-dependent methyltransferase
MRADALAFKDFCQPSGLVLDVGCGPQASPSYLTQTAQVVGIDPLRGEQPRGFTFVQGIGEYLPFRDRMFDQILYATSLDHIIDPLRSLTESSRCVKNDGFINLWIDGLAPSYNSGNTSRLERCRTIVRKGLKNLSRHNWGRKMGIRRTLAYIGSVAQMKIPAGAIDYFHFEHLTLTTIKTWLNELGLVVTKEQDYPEAESIFVQVRPRADGPKDHGLSDLGGVESK